MGILVADGRHWISFFEVCFLGILYARFKFLGKDVITVWDSEIVCKIFCFIEPILKFWNEQIFAFFMTNSLALFDVNFIVISQSYFDFFDRCIFSM